MGEELPEGLCEHGVWMAPPSREDCMDCLADSLRRAGKNLVSERERLRDVIRTLHVNALRANEPAKLVRWMAMDLGDILNGKSLYEAVQEEQADG